MESRQLFLRLAEFGFELGAFALGCGFGFQTLAPLGYEDQIEILPGYEVRTLDAYEYLIGGYVAADDEYGLALKPYPNLRVATYRDYDAALGHWWGADQRRDEDAKKKWWDRIQELQRTMQENGWRIPPLGPAKAGAGSGAAEPTEPSS